MVTETGEMKIRKKKRNNSDIFWGYMMISPVMLGITVFCIWPFFQNFYFSFTKWNSFGKVNWTGFDNYIKLFTDKELLQALLNTCQYIILTLPLSIIISIVLAVLLNLKIKGVGWYRTLYFLPAVTMPVAVAMVWKWLYNGDYGLINFVLSKIGITKIYWITDPKYAMYSLAIVAIWAAIGYNMVIFISGLQGIPMTYYEAAEIDGAGKLLQFRNITLPLLTPTIFFISVTSLLSSFQVFDIIYMMIGKGSPAIEATESIVYVFYKNAFLINEKGYGSSIAVVLFFIILMFTTLQLHLQKKWVHYD